MTTPIGFFDGVYSNSPISFFHQLYVPGITRLEAEEILSINEKRKGAFILRSASRIPLESQLPTGMTSHYCITYWNEGDERYNHLFISCDDRKQSWSVLETASCYKSYPSLHSILVELPPIGSTFFRNALVVGGSTRL